MTWILMSFIVVKGMCSPVMMTYETKKECIENLEMLKTKSPGTQYACVEGYTK